MAVPTTLDASIWYEYGAPAVAVGITRGEDTLTEAATSIKYATTATLAASAASVAWIVTAYVPAVVGVPEIRPVDAFSVRPAGSAPPATDQVTTPFPPVAVTVVAYQMLFRPAGSDAVPMATGAAPIAIEPLAEAAVAGSEASATVIENAKVPLLSGVPLRTPVAESSATPAGSAPLEIVQVYAPLPPEACRAAAYGTVRRPLPGAGIANPTAGGAMTTEKLAAAAIVVSAGSVTATPIVYVPAVDGVPDTVPDASSARPSGSVPAPRLQGELPVPP